MDWLTIQKVPPIESRSKMTIPALVSLPASGRGHADTQIIDYDLVIGALPNSQFGSKAQFGCHPRSRRHWVG